MQGVPEITVLIPTFNRSESLRATLFALAGQTLGTHQYEVIVVDDGSTDGTGAGVAQFGSEHPSLNLRYERHATNRSKAAAWNTGAKATRGELVVFIDDDIRPEPGCLQAHVERHRAEGRNLSVTGLVLYPLEWERRSNWIRFANDNYRKNETIERLDSGSLPPHRFAGGNSSLRRETLVRIGMLDESIRRGQDGDVAGRLYEAGIPLVYEPKAVVYHHAEAIQSIDGTLRSFRKYYEFDRPSVKRKYPSLFANYGHWFLDPPCPDRDGVKRRLIKWAVRTVARRSPQRLAIAVVRLVDRHPRLYFRPLYQYVMACEAVDAIRASEKAAGDSAASDGVR